MTLPVVAAGGLEFDIWRHSSATERFFTVSHSSPNGGYPFAYYLGLLLSHHFNHPSHDVILVTIDIKSSSGSMQSLPQEIDGYITEYFNKDLLFTPGMVFRNPGVSLYGIKHCMRAPVYWLQIKLAGKHGQK
jgi:hypothetical protein